MTLTIDGNRGRSGMETRRSPFVNADATADVSLKPDQLMWERSALRFQFTYRLQRRGQ